MSARGEAISLRARALVGTPFRPQGHDPALGLDCVGTAAAAAGIERRRLCRDYTLRGPSLARVQRGLRELGCIRVPDHWAKPGDVIVCRAGPGQIHLAVATETGVVHADAGLRRVVERPGPPPWPVLGTWRLIGEE